MRIVSLFSTLTLVLAFPLALDAAQHTPVKRVASEAARTPAQAIPADWRSKGYPEERISRLSFRELPARRILDVQNRNARNALKPTQIGIARLVGAEGVQKSLPALHWVKMRDGGSVTLLAVHSPDAFGLRVGLQLTGLAPQVELRFAGSDDPEHVTAVVEAAEALRLRDARRIYWTPATDGDAQIIEMYAPAGVEVDPASIRVVELSHLLTNSKNDFRLIKSIGSAGSCNVDAVCRVGTLPQGYVDAKDSVAKMLFVISGESYLCTGTLLNDNNAGGQIPYFYSAHHCISDATVANTLNTYWGFEATTCGSNVAAANTLLTGGAAYLYSDPITDALLLRLNNAPPAGATFAGWDATAIGAGTAVLAIHHPGGDLKKSSLGKQIGYDGEDSEFNTVGWTSGTTEGGSSGSGLFTLADGSYFLRGGLYGGSASCANTGTLNNVDNRDYYSRLDLVFPHINQYLSLPPINVVPTADFSVATSGLQATFTDMSYDTDGTIALRSWDFGNGALSSATNPVSTYPTWGGYQVQLTVTDDRGATHSTTRSITVDGAVAELEADGARLLTAGADQQRMYKMTIPAGASRLIVSTGGFSGDVDLYVKHGSPPTWTGAGWDYDCASATWRSNLEKCFPVTKGGTYYILLYAASGFSGVSLMGSYIPAANNDFDGDAYSDILWRHSGTGANAIWKGAVASSTQPIARVADTGWKMVGVGDFDGDGKSDILWRHGSTGSNTIWKGGNSATAQALTRITGLAWKVVGVGDFDGDGLSDIFWRNSETGANGIWRSGNYSTQQVTARVSDLSWNVVGVGDFDDDGKSDVLWRNHRTGANTVWKSGRSSTVQTTTGVTDQAWRVSGVGDFNADGKSDILWRNVGNGANTIWLSARASTVQVTSPVTSQAWKIVAVGRYDYDARSDILWRNSSTGANVIWLSGNKATQQAVRGVADPNWTVVP